jgi:hypothetical protein
MFFFSSFLKLFQTNYEIYCLYLPCFENHLQMMASGEEGWGGGGGEMIGVKFFLYNLKKKRRKQMLCSPQFDSSLLC